MKGSKTIRGLKDDPRLLTRVKLENYVFVHLGLRPCSQTTLPAELPNSKALGESIDERTYPLLKRVRAISDPSKKRAAIDAVKREMRAAFKEIAEASDQYRAHFEWVKDLGLRSLQDEVRPTVRELYLFKEREVEKRLKRLMRERKKLRRQALKRPSSDLGRVQLAYPEEFKGGWLREIGELLGYPRCCTEQYALDKGQGVSVEERAAQQIREAEQRGSVDPFAYFVGYFFPCNPDCDTAVSRGNECLESLREYAPYLGELYASVVVENLELVRHQPEIIAEYRARATKSFTRYEH